MPDDWLLGNGLSAVQEEATQVVAPMINIPQNAGHIPNSSLYEVSADLKVIRRLIVLVHTPKDVISADSSHYGDDHFTQTVKVLEAKSFSESVLWSAAISSLVPAQQTRKVSCRKMPYW